jgi:oxalate decarboxylase
MSGQHNFALGSHPAQNTYPSGYRTDAYQGDFPALQGISLSLLVIKPGGFREPHWHPNANELIYCLEGKGLMTVFGPRARHDTFILQEGAIAFIPMGSLHSLQNLSSNTSKFLVCFNNENPEDLQLSSSLSVVPNHVAGATFGLDPAFFKGINAKLEPVFIEKSTHAQGPLLQAWETNPYMMRLDAEQPQVSNAGGWVKMSNSFFMPTLEGLALYSLMLAPKGVREPHWHPNAHELNYLMQGRVRITLLSPDEKVETFEMNPGDISFLPRGYFHYIENITDEPVRMAIFFNHATPSDIGLSGCLGAYPNEMLADIFHLPPGYLDKLPKFQEDLFVVAGGG